MKRFINKKMKVKPKLLVGNRRVTLLFGKICSGKSTFAKTAVEATGGTHITVSDIVKKVSGKVTRSELQTTAHMDVLISEELINEIAKHDYVFVDGIRQKSIVHNVCKRFGVDNVMMIWLNVPDEMRRLRFENRRVKKDDITFEEADYRDNKLGLEELQKSLEKSYIKLNNY